MNEDQEDYFLEKKNANKASIIVYPCKFYTLFFILYILEDLNDFLQNICVDKDLFFPCIIYLFMHVYTYLPFWLSTSSM